MRRCALAAALLLAPVTTTGPARGGVVDRAVYVFDTPETGGPSSPRFIFARELAFEARLEAFAAGESPLDDAGRYASRHVRAALERHVATEILASLLASLPTQLQAPLAPQLDPCERPLVLDASGSDDVLRLLHARALLVARAGGEDNLKAAAAAEGMTRDDIARLVRREAQATRYLDQMVAPMLQASEAETRETYRKSRALSQKPFDEARCDARRLLIATRLSAAYSIFHKASLPRLSAHKPTP